MNSPTLLIRSRPRLLKLRSSNGFIVTVVSLAIFTDVFLCGLIVPVAPAALVERAGVPAADVQKWISGLLAVYGAGVLVASPVFGVIADRQSSRRLPFVLGLVALAASTALFTLGRSPAAFLLARAFQGLSAAAVWIVGLALLVDTVGKDKIGQAMGIAGIAMTWAMMSAPVVGGFIYDRAGYHAVFVPAIALVLLDIGLRLAVVEKKVAQKWLFYQSSNCNSLCGDSGSYGTFQDKDSCDGFCTSIDSIRYNNVSSDRNAHDFINTKRWKSTLSPSIHMLKSARLRSALLGILVSMALYSAIETTIPLYVTETFYWTASGGGLALFAMSIPSCLSILVGQWVDRRGSRVPAAMGFLLTAPMLVLLRLVDKNNTVHQALLALILLLIGLFLSTVEVAMMSEMACVVASLQEANPAFFGNMGGMVHGYGLFNVAVAGGQLIGPLVGGFVRQELGWNAMSLLLASLSLLAVVPTALWTGGWIGNMEGGKESYIGDNGEDI